MMRSRPLLALLCCLLMTGCSVRADEQSPPEQVRAGGKDGPLVLPAFRDTKGFKALPKPRRGDWRLGPGRDERPQTFPAYRKSDPVKATARRDRIVLQPLGPFDAKQREMLDQMKRFAAVYFGCKVEVARPLPLPKAGRRTRRWGERRWVQHHTTTIFRQTLLPRLPANAICYLGITMGDLYPEKKWNYVFGQAYLNRRTGVYSLARYFAAFWGDAETEQTRRKALLRSCKVLAHETGHMFSIEHCLHFLCVMNGSNSLDESDRQPLHLGPVCASKLTWNRGFDPAARYRKLAALYQEMGLGDQATWTKLQAARVAPAANK